MNKIIACVLLVLAATGAWAGQAAGAGRVPEKVRVTADQANIREKPDIGSAMLQQVPQGTVLDADSREGEWFLIRFIKEDGTEATGYIHESLVRAEVETGATPPPAKAKPKTEPARPVREPPSPETATSRPAATPETDEDAGYSLSFFGGGNYAAGGDLNAGLEGLVDYYGDVLGRAPSSAPDGLHLTYIFGAEAHLPLAPGLSLALGLDYFNGRNTSLADFSQGSASRTLLMKPSLSALPFKAGFVFYPAAGLYFKAGLGYYFVTCGYSYRLDMDAAWKEWEGKASSQGLGAEGAVGGEWEFYPRVLFFAEVSARHARIGGFEGRTTVLGTADPAYTEEGTLWSYMVKGSGGAEYPLLFIRERRPSDAGVSNAREAKVDFSGAALRFGIRMRF